MKDKYNFKPEITRAVQSALEAKRCGSLDGNSVELYAIYHFYRSEKFQKLLDTATDHNVIRGLEEEYFRVRMIIVNKLQKELIA